MPKDNQKDTENKIKEAARKMFHAKGFAATKTRDIAQEAGINLALLNYYFRSKQKLYDLIMLETIQTFFGTMFPILNDDTTNLKEKIAAVTSNYIDLLIENKSLPLFITNEASNNSETFKEKLPFLNMMQHTVLFKQFREEQEKGNLPKINPIHIMLNISSLTIFPFLAHPMLQVMNDLQEEEFRKLMNERKRLIPIWIESMMNVE